jgi:MoxR-like ATPase
MNQPAEPARTRAALTALTMDCPSCGKSLRLPGDATGRKTRCPACQTIFTIPQAEDFPTASPTGSAPVMATVADAPTARMAVNPLDQLIPGHRGSELYHRIAGEVRKLFVGQEELVLGTLIAVVAGGHVLIESVPGLGKTLFVRTLGKALGCHFGRIQFTADLMPSDVTGAPIFNAKTQDFVFRRGPVFTQLLLCDEINRSPAKTHAALLEIMQERNVTVDGTTHELEPPFVVLATQNPIESEGTYNLPEAQLDRFLFKLVAGYPELQQETEIVGRHSTLKDLGSRLDEDICTVTSPAELLAAGRESESVRVDPRLVHYITKIVRATRGWPSFHAGASPRAAIGLVQAVRVLAAFCGRDYAVPDDVVQLARPVLRHRVRLTAEAEVEGQSVDRLIGDVIRSIEIPRLD